MAVSKMRSGRWRAQVYCNGRNVAVGTVLGPGFESFRTKREAVAAVARAQTRLGATAGHAVTVSEFRERWLTDPLFTDGLKGSSVAARAEGTRRFAASHGDLELRQVNDLVVARWLAAGHTGSYQLNPLKAMWNAAGSAKAGRLTDMNPWAGLGLKRSEGRRRQQPPSQLQLEQLIEACEQQAGAMFAAWFTVGAFTGMRPGELDALRWERVDFEHDRIHVVEQFSHKTKRFDSPKNGLSRQGLLTPRARAALNSLPRVAEFCFVNQWGRHYRGPLRSMIWQRVKAQTGYQGDLYLATRHYAGWYMTNVLRLDAQTVATVLGHTDGGRLVQTLYGHLDEHVALDRALTAFEQAGTVTPIRKTGHR